MKRRYGIFTPFLSVYIFLRNGGSSFTTPGGAIRSWPGARELQEMRTRRIITERTTKNCLFQVFAKMRHNKNFIAVASNSVNLLVLAAQHFLAGPAQASAPST